MAGFARGNGDGASQPVGESAIRRAADQRMIASLQVAHRRTGRRDVVHGDDPDVADLDQMPRPAAGGHHAEDRLARRDHLSALDVLVAKHAAVDVTQTPTRPGISPPRAGAGDSEAVPTASETASIAP